MAFANGRGVPLAFSIARLDDIGMTTPPVPSFLFPNR
jgi:hypothetical protein